MSDQHSPEISIFLEAIEKETPEDVRAYLDEACGDDQQLRGDVEALLVAHRKLSFKALSNRMRPTGTR